MGTQSYFFYKMLGFGAFYRKNGKNVLPHDHFQLSDASSSRVHQVQCQSRLNGNLDG